MKLYAVFASNDYAVWTKLLGVASTEKLANSWIKEYQKNNAEWDDVTCIKVPLNEKSEVDL
jgi:hypothetical protein